MNSRNFFKAGNFFLFSCIKDTSLSSIVDGDGRAGNLKLNMSKIEVFCGEVSGCFLVIWFWYQGGWITEPRALETKATKTTVMIKVKSFIVFEFRTKLAQTIRKKKDVLKTFQVIEISIDRVLL